MGGYCWVKIQRKEKGQRKEERGKSHWPWPDGGPGAKAGEGGRESQGRLIDGLPCPLALVSCPCMRTAFQRILTSMKAPRKKSMRLKTRCSRWPDIRLSRWLPTALPTMAMPLIVRVVWIEKSMVVA